ncbi:DUF2065 domain-containing protein [Marivita cryptomonadis]|uniref:DUF2065 domain-containing protein n=1 Tax=Marivita cryptomonadis TaxID=505252 RepID=A0A9Q2NSU4_9RHOB|nr:DUF2065 domain-containing protein [Marivita cryptomonadis]MBM2329929.1 DUF2065 domain-containing protein [Marivita cryptomonadis]MBM2339516.1 DUF2065 domain-containing protein [Marivita cryptomonadis]MBM2344175.1 DUF2065 domain-containing protein [Marivita cryptomonadis]MBM2348853.1 DUF2065 domain-containing protein [Marivita cryptomonadis]
METVIQGIALVLIIEGLAYALAPSLIERMLEAMRDMPLDMRRLIGVSAIAAGITMLWILQAF